jgi:ADP-ribosyl-[dinitrogen reductase] hydrolase
MYNEIILNGIKMGDQNGGPYELSKIVDRSLMACNGYNKRVLIERYLSWWLSNGYDAGPTFASVLKKNSDGIKPSDATKKVHLSFNGKTAGCGPAHRILPIAGFLKFTNEELINISFDEAKITHFHPDAGYGSAILVLLCRFLIEGQTLEEAKISLTQNEFLRKSWAEVSNAEIKPDGYIYNVIKSSLYFMSISDSLERSIKFAGPQITHQLL